MSSESIDAVSGFCLRIALTSYERLAPRGRILQTSVALAERDALLLAWAMSNDMDEIAQAVVGRHWGMHQSETVESTIKFGQISGSIDARETLLQQHLTADLSLFVVNEVVPTKASLDQRNVVAWALKVACNQISKALHKDQCHGKPKQFLEERLAVQKTALAMPVLKGALSGRLGVFLPSEAAINNARRSKVGLNPKAGDALRIYQGLMRLAPFAVRRIVSESVIDRDLINKATKWLIERYPQTLNDSEVEVISEIADKIHHLKSTHPNNPFATTPLINATGLKKSNSSLWS